MILLSIETSCDETAISIVDAEGTLQNSRFSVLANITLSQSKLHEKFGGVYPSLAKREHAKNLVPLLRQALKESNFLNVKIKSQNVKNKSSLLHTLLEREPELLNQLLKFIPAIEKPPIDAIAVTYGPGLEPALWVGVNFAKALSLMWKLPIIPINHMQGHLFSALLKAEKRISNFKFLISKQSAKRTQKNAEKDRGLHATRYTLHDFQFPILALLISGGHTELVLCKKWFEYEIVGQTRDDAVGETFDKVARMLGLPYPGGPEIAKIASKFKIPQAVCRQRGRQNSKFKLPRPMIGSHDFDFSFSGLKTAVLYSLREVPKITDAVRGEVAYEFQEAATEVLVTKLEKAVNHYRAKTVLVGGGVSANNRVQESIREKLKTKDVHVAPRELTGDNALMIAVAGYVRFKQKKSVVPASKIKALGNVRLSKKD